MKVMTILTAVAFAAVTIAFNSGSAAAQASRTWVSGVGDDANPCSRTAPCKTFAGAISKTGASGEINCLDPGGFGTVTITKSITIDCTGTFGSILSSSTTGLIVNGTEIDVILRGLSINGGPLSFPGLNGIRYLQGRSVLVEDVRIAGFSAVEPDGNGIIVNNSTGLARLTILNSTIVRNGNGAAAGIQIAPTGTASANVTIMNTIISDNDNGVRAIGTGTSGPINIFARDIVASGNATNGITIVGGGPVKATIENASILGNGANGLRANNPSATILVGRSVISGNGVGLAPVSGGIIRSFGDNHVAGNGADGNPTSTVAPK